MYYLTTADMWIGVKDGKLCLHAGGTQVSCQLRAEGEFVRRVARPLKQVLVEPMTRSAVRCVVDPLYEEEKRMVVDTIWYPESHVKVPSALVPPHDEIVLPLVNYGDQTVLVKENQPIALLQEATECSDAVGENLPELVRAASIRKTEGAEAGAEASPASQPTLLEFLCDLRDRSIRDSMQLGDEAISWHVKYSKID